MESKACDPTAPTANKEVPAVNLSDDGSEPRYQLTTIGHDRLVRARDSLHWLKRQTGDRVHQDMLAAFLLEIETILTEVTVTPLPGRCATTGS